MNRQVPIYPSAPSEPTSIRVGEWRHSVEHGEPGRVVEVDALWNRPTCILWLPRRDVVVRVRPDRLVPLTSDDGLSLDALSYASAAARIVDSLERDALVAPFEASVIPLPHQLYALRRAINGEQIRFLLADEVGLGKTIEAGLILRELKVRGLVQRVLVVAPSGLVPQWVSEMKARFNEDFRVVLPGQFSALRDAGGMDDSENLWRLHDQVVCPLDSVKPLEARRGWSSDQLARHNRDRFEDLVAAGWDLVVIDEAHRLAGSTERVARFKLGEALAQSVPYLLLLSATPHQGKSEAFRRLVGFLDPGALPADEDISREIVAPLVIRTEKRQAIDTEGNALFKPRRTELIGVEWSDTFREQRELYDAVTEYVRDGYNRAMRERRTAIGFLMILFQRLVASSSVAIRVALERRLDMLDLPPAQLPLFPEDLLEDWSDRDGQEQLDTVLATRIEGLDDEREEVERLLAAARRCEALGPDLKASALLERIESRQREENDPLLKVLVFTEFVETQRMLAEFLGQHGYSAVCLNGSLGVEERQEVQRRFAADAQVLVCTDAGGEGLNLQFCHFVVNYDLPWNPMKLEQRIGRVDRIGQEHVVRALNFALEDTVEWRMREVLETKLRTILEEFGADKLADVLDSEEDGGPFESLFVDALLSPEGAGARAEELVSLVRERAGESRAGGRILTTSGSLDPTAARRVAEHRIPFWTERMTLSYLSSRRGDGSSVLSADVGYDLRWPDGTETRSAVFGGAGNVHPGTTRLSLDDGRVRAIMEDLPVFAPGQPIPAVVVQGVSELVSGTWSLWRIGLRAGNGAGRRRRFLPVFVASDGRVLVPTARAVWDRLTELGEGVEPTPGKIDGEAARRCYREARLAAEESGAPVFDELVAAERTSLERERKKGFFAFAMRRSAIGRIGHAQVRARRLRELEDEEGAWQSELVAREEVLPELDCVAIAAIEPPGFPG